MKSALASVTVLCLLPSFAAASPPTIPTAAAVFARGRALCEADKGRLWGVSLCVPRMLVDPSTRQAIANVPLPGATRDGDYYRLTLPADVVIANSPVAYEGVRLSELTWPMYGSAEMQSVTLMHEAFHIVQPKLGFNGYAGMGSVSGVPSLDTEAGRIWLRGELSALSVALTSSGAPRARALRDALAMRFYRHYLFPGSGEQERELDVIEGLAEATGIDAGLPPGRRIAYTLSDIARIEGQPSYARAFPYATGPAYAELLDAAEPQWRRSVTAASDIARMTMRAYGLNVKTPSPSRAQAIAARYDGAEIESQEAARAARKAVLYARYTRELVTGPTIALPMAHFNIQFTPRDVETLDPYGSVYHTLRVIAAWGEITVSGGDALISKDFKVLTVAVPTAVNGSVVRGEKWTLTLAPGYALAPDPRKPGSYHLLPMH
ncbi:MAG: hypothetical protein ACREMP_01585 [Candidatus Tyrphobacter sp.]